MEKNFLSVQNLTTILGVGRPQIYALRRQGVLPPGVKIGRRLFWRPGDVQAYLDKLNGKGKLELHELLSMEGCHEQG